MRVKSWNPQKKWTLTLLNFGRWPVSSILCILIENLTSTYVKFYSGHFFQHHIFFDIYKFNVHPCNHQHFKFLVSYKSNMNVIQLTFIKNYTNKLRTLKQVANTFRKRNKPSSEWAKSISYCLRFCLISQLTYLYPTNSYTRCRFHACEKMAFRI